MACDCIHQYHAFKFPIFGPAPIGPTNRWPVYFVPSSAPEDAGFGHYYCPCCKDGLAEAREAAGLPKEEEPAGPTLSFFMQANRMFCDFWSTLFGSIRPQPTAGGSR